MKYEIKFYETDLIHPYIDKFFINLKEKYFNHIKSKLVGTWYCYVQIIVM